jgi:hypothetical protein
MRGQVGVAGLGPGRGAQQSVLCSAAGAGSILGVQRPPSPPTPTPSHPAPPTTSHPPAPPDPTPPTPQPVTVARDVLSVIVECGDWTGCAEGDACRQRVAQRGLQFRLEVFKTRWAPGRGRGAWRRGVKRGSKLPRLDRRACRAPAKRSLPPAGRCQLCTPRYSPSPGAAAGACAAGTPSPAARWWRCSTGRSSGVEGGGGGGWGWGSGPSKGPLVAKSWPARTGAEPRRLRATQPAAPRRPRNAPAGTRTRARRPSRTTPTTLTATCGWTGTTTTSRCRAARCATTCSPRERGTARPAPRLLCLRRLRRPAAPTPASRLRRAGPSLPPTPRHAPPPPPALPSSLPSALPQLRDLRQAPGRRRALHQPQLQPQPLRAAAVRRPRGPRDVRHRAVRGHAHPRVDGAHVSAGVGAEALLRAGGQQAGRQRRARP